MRIGGRGRAGHFSGPPFLRSEPHQDNRREIKCISAKLSLFWLHWCFARPVLSPVRQQRRRPREPAKRWPKPRRRPRQGKTGKPFLTSRLALVFARRFPCKLTKLLISCASS